MSLYRHDEDDPGRTGTWSPAKVSALVFGLMAPAPVVLFYMEIGPSDVGLLTAMAASGGLAILSAGLWWGLGRGAFQGLAEALTKRVED